MKNNGFTLLEILIALVIFTVLATITASIFSTLFKTQQRVTVASDRLNTLQLAVALLEQDAANMRLPEPDAFDEKAAAAIQANSTEILFTRGGVINPESFDKRSTLQRVDWRCEGNKLVRLTWSNGKQTKRILIDQLRHCHLAYLTLSREIVPAWNDESILPLAIQVSLTLIDWGKMSLLFSIPETLHGH